MHFSYIYHQYHLYHYSCSLCAAKSTLFDNMMSTCSTLNQMDTFNFVINYVKLNCINPIMTVKQGRLKMELFNSFQAGASKCYCRSQSALQQELRHQLPICNRFIITHSVNSPLRLCQCLRSGVLKEEFVLCGNQTAFLPTCTMCTCKFD